jgi:hypothetical protein
MPPANYGNESHLIQLLMSEQIHKVFLEEFDKENSVFKDNINI